MKTLRTTLWTMLSAMVSLSLVFHSVMGQTGVPVSPHQNSNIYLPLILTTGQQTTPLIPNQYIVVFNDFMLQSVSVASTDLADSVGGTLLYTYTSAFQGFVIELPATRDALAIQGLENDPRVAFVEQDRLITLDDTQAVETGQPNPTWGLDRADQHTLPLDGVYNYIIDGSNVHVYVIDSGIRTTHSEFGGRATVGFDAINDGNADCHGHGTHVAGTIGGATFGVAKGVQLVSVRVFDCNGTTSTSTVLRGIDWVTQNRILPAVANMSLGGSTSDALDRAVRKSIQAGVAYVIAAGNNSRPGNDVDACTRSPARVLEAITVGATNQVDQRATFSNVGSCVDIFAPGEGITSAGIVNDNVSRNLSGTSMATPHVAGAAALYWEINPGASPADVQRVILDNSTPNVVGNAGNNSPNRLLYIPVLGICESTGEGVYLYQHDNYQGPCSKFTADSNNPGTWVIGNDQASSIRIVGNWAARIFKDADYRGESTLFAADDPHLGDDAIGNDNASSIQVQRQTNCDGEEGIYLYQHVNFQGPCSKFITDSNNPALWLVKNDNASSLRVIGKWTATLYQHADFQGASSEFVADDAWLGDNAVGNDQVSSIRVQRESNCDGGEGVYLYWHANYEGGCSKFTFDSRNPALWYIGNDTASSIRIIGNWAAIVYEHADFQGASSKFIGDDTWLGGDTIGNDTVSSIRVQKVEPRSGEGVYLYADANYQGRCSNFIEDSNNPAFWVIGNDAASSIRIVGKWSVTVYQHADFQGASTIYTSDDPNLGNDAIGNDRVSSIRVQRR